MANNRLFITHRPTGLSVYLGKRMAGGWYDVPCDLAEMVRRLFARVQFEDGRDDFCVSLEDPSDSTLANCDWKAIDADISSGLLVLVKEHQDVG